MAADDVPGPKNQPRFKGTGAPATAADLNILGNYAALVGNRKAGTAAERTTATNAGEVWPGLEWAETDTGLFWYFTLSSTWVITGGAEEVGAFSFGGLYKNHPDYENIRLSRRGKSGKLKGNVTTNQVVNFGANTVYTLGTIPPGWRPASGAQPFDSSVASTTSTVPAWIRVATSGELQVAFVSATASAGDNGMVLAVDLEWTIA